MIPNPKILPTAERQGNTIVVKRAGGATGETIVVKILPVTGGMDGPEILPALTGTSDATTGDIGPLTSGALAPGTYHVIMKTSKNGTTTSDSDTTVVILPPTPPMGA